MRIPFLCVAILAVARVHGQSASMITGIPSTIPDERFAQMEKTLSALKPLLPVDQQASFSPETLANTTLLELLFQGNTSAAQERFQQQFRLQDWDQNHDNGISLDEMKRLYRQQMGLIRYSFERAFQNLTGRFEQEYREMDLDGMFR